MKNNVSNLGVTIMKMKTNNKTVKLGHPRNIYNTLANHTAFTFLFCRKLEVKRDDCCNTVSYRSVAVGIES